MSDRLTVMRQVFSSVRRRTHPWYENRMPGLKRNVCVLTLALLSSAACTPSIRHEEAVPPVNTVPTGASEDRRVLACEWEYEDGAVVTLTLDEQGNGTYPWKDGRFITHSLSDHVWQGMWVQEENDREGGFIVPSRRISQRGRADGGTPRSKMTARRLKRVEPST